MVALKRRFNSVPLPPCFQQLSAHPFARWFHSVPIHFSLFSDSNCSVLIYAPLIYAPLCAAQSCTSEIGQKEPSGAEATYCAFIQVSEPATLTATSEKKTRIGLPSANPRRSVEMRRGPAFFWPPHVAKRRLGFLVPPR